MKKIEKSTTTNSLFVDFLKFYLWLFVAFSTKIPQIKWPGYDMLCILGDVIKSSDSVWSPMSPIVEYYVPAIREQGAGLFNWGELH